MNNFPLLRLECVLSFQEEETMGGIPYHDEHEMCFEYVDVAEGQFTTSQEPVLHTENVDSLLIKQDVPIEQNYEMVSGNVTVFVTKESGKCFENVDTSDEKEYGTCFKIVDVRSIKEEPADEGNVTEDPLAMGESIKEEQDIKQEHETQFMKNEEIKGRTFKNIKIAAEQSAENVIGTHIKEEQSEIEEDNRAHSVNASLKRDQLVGDCIISTVMVKEEELGGTEANEVLRLVPCFCYFHTYCIRVKEKGVLQAGKLWDQFPVRSLITPPPIYLIPLAALWPWG
jgi:hypothetical protein